MKQRFLIPILGFLALLALFFKLPEAPRLFECKLCLSKSPYLALIGAGYFATLISLFFLFPTFPNRKIALGGLVWAFLLALVLTILPWPFLCPLCLFAHGCHILLWILWLFLPPLSAKTSPTPLHERLCLTFFSPLVTIAFFASMNLTFMVYDYHFTSPTVLKPGDSIPYFSAQGAPLLINFIAPDCPYCKKQLPIVHSVATQLAEAPSTFIYVTPAITSELREQSPDGEWYEDRDGKLRRKFKVKGFPTLFLVNSEGKIVDIIQGVPDDLDATLLAELSKN